MKKLRLIAILLLVTGYIFAQAPDKMTFQAVVRNAANNIIVNQVIGMRISVLQGSASGTAVYVETQTPTANQNGLVTMEIGNGTVVTGTFSAINWANGPYFVKTETDPNGGTSYSITGTSQLLSVPYALFAKSATVTNGLVVYSGSSGGSINQTISDLTMRTIIVTYGGSSGLSSTINLTLPAASSYAAGTVISFSVSAYSTGEPGWNITSPSSFYSSLNHNGTAMTGGLSIGTANGFRLVSDGVSNWYRVLP